MMLICRYSVLCVPFAVCPELAFLVHPVPVRHKHYQGHSWDTQPRWASKLTSLARPVLPLEQGSSKRRPGTEAWQRDGGEWDPLRVRVSIVFSNEFQPASWSLSSSSFAFNFPLKGTFLHFVSVVPHIHHGRYLGVVPQLPLQYGSKESLVPPDTDCVASLQWEVENVEMWLSWLWQHLCSVLRHRSALSFPTTRSQAPQVLMVLFSQHTLSLLRA